MLYVTLLAERTIVDALIEFRDEPFDPRSERALWCASREAAAILEGRHSFRITDSEPRRCRDPTVV